MGYAVAPVVATGLVYAPAALAVVDEKSIEYYVIANFQANAIKQTVITTAAGYIGKYYGWHVLFTQEAQAILKWAEETQMNDPTKLIKLLEPIAKKAH